MGCRRGLGHCELEDSRTGDLQLCHGVKTLLPLGLHRPVSMEELTQTQRSGRIYSVTRNARGEMEAYGLRDWANTSSLWEKPSQQIDRGKPAVRGAGH